MIRKKADTSRDKLKKRKQEALDNPDILLSKVTKRIVENVDVDPKDQSQPSVVPDIKPKSLNPFPNLNKKESKLVGSILDVIRENTDTKTFELLKTKIIEAVKR